MELFIFFFCYETIKLRSLSQRVMFLFLDSQKLQKRIESITRIWTVTWCLEYLEYLSFELLPCLNSFKPLSHMKFLSSF